MFFIIYCCITFNKSYAKYTYSLNESIIKLSRDSRIANYVINYSEKNEYVNTDISVLVNFDKEIDYLEGFIKKDDYTFEKVYTQNVNENLIFEDYYGNKSTLNIVINNIDKELPKIIGIENKDNLILPLKLDYLDNIGIKNVEIEKYGSDLNYRLLEFFYDTESYYGVDVLDTSIKVKIIEKPLDTKKYKYYLNDVLYGITDNIEYVYTGLIPMTDYVVKIEAIDECDNVLAEKSKTITTQCFKEITEMKTDNLGIITLTDITDEVDSIKVAIWNGNDEEKKVWVNANYNKESKNLTFVFNPETFSYRNDENIYRIHFHFTDINGNVIHIFACNIKFGVTLNEEDDIIIDNVYEITSSGNYKIIVEDIAGNKVEELITVK